MDGGHPMKVVAAYNPGTLWMIASAASFSIMALSAKMLPDLPALEKVFFRSIISVLLTWYALYAGGVKIRVAKKTLLTLRSIFGFAGLYCYFEAIDRLPLGTAVTIYNTTPIFAAAIGIFLLKEFHSKKRIVSILIAVIGIAFLKGFSINVTWAGMMFGLLTAFFSAIAYSLVRVLGNSEHPLIIVLAFPLLSIPLSLLLGWGEMRMPVGAEWWWLIALGVGTQGGQVCLTHGLRYHTATRATQIGFVGVLFAMILGVFAGDGIPSSSDFFGALLIFLGIYFGAQNKLKSVE